MDAKAGFNSAASSRAGLSGKVPKPDVVLTTYEVVCSGACVSVFVRPLGFLSEVCRVSGCRALLPTVAAALGARRADPLQWQPGGAKRGHTGALGRDGGVSLGLPCTCQQRDCCCAWTLQGGAQGDIVVGMACCMMALGLAAGHPVAMHGSLALIMCVPRTSRHPTWVLPTHN